MRISPARPQSTQVSGQPRADLLAILRRHKLVFLTALLGVLLLTLAALVILPVRYIATGSLIVAEPEVSLDSQTVTNGADRQGDPADMESQILLIKASRLLRLAIEPAEVQEAVLRECKARNSGKMFGIIPAGAADICNGDVKTNEKLLDQIQQHYAISAAGRSRVITISYDSPMADVAQIMANALTNAFLNDRHAAAVRTREDASAYLNQQVQQVQAALKQDEDRIQAFRRKNGLVRGGNAPISSERLSSAATSLNQAEAARADALARLNEVRRAQKSGYSELPTVLASRTIGDLKQQLANVTAQLASNEATLGPRHPAYIALQQEQVALRHRLDAEMANVAASAQRNYDAANATVNALRTQVGKVQTEAGAAADDEASIADLVRDAEIKRNQYVELTKKVGDLETQKRVVGGNIRLVSLADLPLLPFFPKKIPFLAGGLTAGALLGLALAVLLDRRDQSLRTSSALSAGTGQPTIAEVPMISAGKRGVSFSSKTGLALSDCLTNMRNEPKLQAAFDALATTLTVKNGGKFPRSLLVASALPAEGRTFTVLGLGQAIAATGRRVLILECDLQNPSLSAALNLAESFGLFGILQGKIRPNDAVFATGIPNLFVIPAGRSVINSSDVLMGEPMQAVLEWAQRFDVVLLDSPPTMLKLDSSVLAKQVEAVICCARWGSADVSDVSAAVEELQASGGHVAGVVMTMVDVAQRAYYEKRPATMAYAKAS